MQELQACDLFINIPFTTRAVDALDTNCYANTPPAVKRAYLQAVLAEMEGFSEEARELAVTSVTLGGGSASTLPADDLRRLLRGIARAFDTPRDVPVFATFDPGLLSIGQALELKAFGSPRIDLRYFTSDAREANLLGCPAPETETKKTDIVLEHAGIADIGMHVALGMVGQSEESLLKTLRAARRSSVKRFVLAPVLPGHTLASSNDDAAELYDCARTWLEQHGFERQGPLRFALEGAENPLEENWYTNPLSARDHEVLSFGPSTLSCSGGLMWTNTGDIDRYIENCTDPQAITARVAVLDDVARIQRDEFATLYRGESVPFDAERHERAIENDLLERTSDEDEALIKLSSKGCLRYRQAFEQIAAARP